MHILELNNTFTCIRNDAHKLPYSKKKNIIIIMANKKNYYKKTLHNTLDQYCSDVYFVPFKRVVRQMLGRNVSR